jgi:hypothetical protein
MEASSADEEGHPQRELAVTQAMAIGDDEENKRMR